MGTSQNTRANSSLLWHTNIRCANEKQTYANLLYADYTLVPTSLFHQLKVQFSLAVFVLRSETLTLLYKVDIRL